MTTYYNSEYQEVSEYELHEMFHDHLDSEYPAYTILWETYSPSEIVKSSGQDSTAYRQLYVAWIDSMLDSGELYEGESEFIDSLLDDWLHGDGWTDAWEDVDSTDLLFAAQHMHSTGRLELVDGEIQPHPHHTVSTIQELINDELAR